MIERRRAWRRLSWVSRLWWRGAGLQRERGFGYAVNRWASNGPPNGTKFDGRSTGDISRPLGKSRPLPGTFSPAHETRSERGDGRVRVWLGSVRTTQRTGRTRTDASFEKHVDEMQMMTWQSATRKQMTWQRGRITGRHQAHPYRGITVTLRWAR